MDGFTIVVYGWDIESSADSFVCNTVTSQQKYFQVVGWIIQLEFGFFCYFEVDVADNQIKCLRKKMSPWGVLISNLLETVSNVH